MVMDEVVKKTIVGELDERWDSVDDVINFITTELEKEQAAYHTISHLSSTPDSEQTLYLKDMKPGMKVSPSMTLHDILGRGGFGRVFKVWHDMQKQYLAIKIFEKDRIPSLVQFSNNSLLDDFVHPLWQILSYLARQ